MNLRNAKQFAEEMERRGFAREEGQDTSSLRKTVYKFVKPHIETYRRAVEAARKEKLSTQ